MQCRFRPMKLIGRIADARQPQNETHSTSTKNCSVSLLDNMDIRRQVGKNLQQLRKERGWTQERLSFETGIQRSYISGVERGVRNPTILIIQELAAALGVHPAKLLETQK